MGIHSANDTVWRTEPSFEMAPVTSVSSPPPQSLVGNGPGEGTNSTDPAVAPLQTPDVSVDAELKEDEGEFLPLKKFSRMQVLSCIVQLETKSFIECTNKGCLYISLTIWDMAYHLPKCEGSKGSDKLKRCRYCPHGTQNLDALYNHMILSHPYAPEVLDKNNRSEFKDLREEEREAFLTSSFARAIIRSQWRICYQTKGYIICLTQTCHFVTCLIPVMEDHYVRCSPQLWENLKFSCGRCPGRTFSEEALDDHKEECHNSQNVVYNTVDPKATRFWEVSLALYGASKCVGLHCKFIASNKNELERHWRYCRTPHIENYEDCEYCGGWCDTSDDKAQHIRVMHSRLSTDESVEALKELKHLEMLKTLLSLDLSSDTFPWTKVMSFGGETILNRLVEGIEEPPVTFKILKKKKRKFVSKHTHPPVCVKPPPDPKKVVPKKEKPDIKRAVTARRRSSKASEIDIEIPLHAIKAEELFIPDKTFLEDLGQAIETECLEIPKVELQISVGNQSWTVEAPSLETASEVITRKMPSYSMKSVLAQSIEDSLNLLQIEAMVSSIENVSTKPYVPPMMLSFTSKPNVAESLKKKFDLVRQREVKEKCTDSFMTGDSFSGAQEIEVTPQEPAKTLKQKAKQSKRKEFKSGVRPWQSLARIKFKPAPESDGSSSEDLPVETSTPNKCKILLPKNKEPSKDNDVTSNNKKGARKELTIISRAGKNCKVTTLPVTSADLEYKKLAKILPSADCTKLVRDVSIQHGSSAFPVFSEQLINNRYNRATLLIGYPYSVLKSEYTPVNVDISTQTATRHYSGRQFFNQKPTAHKTVRHSHTSLPAVATGSSCNVQRPPGTSQAQKKLVVFRTLVPVDPMNSAGASILKETRVIGGLKQTVIKNLSQIGVNGALGPPRLIRFVSGPISRASLNPGASPVPVGIPVRTLVPCSAPALFKKVPRVFTTLATSAPCTPASYVEPLVTSNCGSSNRLSISCAPVTTFAPTDVVKAESLDTESIADTNCKPVSVRTFVSAASTVSRSAPAIETSVAAPMASIVLSNAAPAASVVSSRPASAASVLSSCAAPTASIASSSAAARDSGPPLGEQGFYSSALFCASRSCSSTPSSAPSDLPGFSPSATVSTINGDSSISVMAPVSRGSSNVVFAISASSAKTSPSKTTPLSLNRTPNLKTYSNSSKLGSLFQTAKRPRLDIPSPLESCSKETSLPEQGKTSRIPLNVPILARNKSASLCGVNSISDPEESRLNSSKSTWETYLNVRPTSSIRLSCSSFEEATCYCGSRGPLRYDHDGENKYGIFDGESYYDECQYALASIKFESKPATSKGYNHQRNGEFDDSDPIIIHCESDILENCNALDPSIPFEVFCDSSTAAHGGLYNDQFPWEGQKFNIIPSLEKSTFINSSQISSQTTLHMEVDEDPIVTPRFKNQPAELCQCVSAPIMEETVENTCKEAITNANVESNSEKVNELAKFLTNHDGLQVRNESMVYVLNKILLDQRNLNSEILNDNDEQRLKELVHYLTHYNRILAENEAVICIANKITRDVPSTPTNSDKGPQDSARGRKSLQPKKADASRSEKLTVAENSGLSERTGKKSVAIPPKKRQRKSAGAVSAYASSSANQSDSELPKPIVDSTTSTVQELSERTPTKKRGRKSKSKQEELTSTEDVSKALANTNLGNDDTSRNAAYLSDSEQPKAILDSTTPKVKELNVQAPTKKRDRKLKVNKKKLTSTEHISKAVANATLDDASGSPANWSDSEQPKPTVDSTISKVQEISEQAPTKIRGREPKNDQKELTSSEDITKALVNTKLDDASKNGKEGNKTSALKKPSRKPKHDIPAENEIKTNTKKDDHDQEPKNVSRDPDVDQQVSEQSKATVDPTTSKVIELSEKTSMKKRGRKSKIKQEELTSTEDVFKALVNNKLDGYDDDASENPANRSDPEQPEAILDSVIPTVQELIAQAPTKKRGRKLKNNQDELTSSEDVTKALVNSKLDDASKNEHEGSKMLTLKKAGRKPKKSVATENENEIMGNRLQENTNEDDHQESRSVSMDLDVEQPEAEVGKTKASWKKTRISAVKPTDVLLEMEVEPGDDQDVQQMRAGRRKKTPQKKSLDPVETGEEIFGDVGPPPKPKKRGRPPNKPVEAEWTPNQPDDDNGNRFLYHDNDDGNDEDLVPPCDRIIFNSSLPNPNQMVTCAVCNNRMTALVYKKEHVYKHNHICWLRNEEPMDLDDELALERHLYKVYCHLRKPFHCEVCTKAVKSARGFLSHRKFCGKTMKERRENMVACTVCTRLLKPSSISYHMQHHHSKPTLPSPVKEKPVELLPRAAVARCLEKMSSAVEAPGPEHIDELEEKSFADAQPWVRRCYHLEKRRITQAIKTLFTERIEKEGVARCLNVGCDRSDVNVKSVIEHYRTCDVICLDYKCKVCAFMDSGEYVMIHHVRTLHEEKYHHHTEKMSTLGNDVGAMPEFSGKFLPYLKAAEDASRSLLFLQPALFWTYKMKNEFVASGCVFPELSIGDNAINSVEDYPPAHFVLRDKSMRIAFNGNSLEWINLNKLTSCTATNNSVILYTGGVVRSLDWFPTDKEQYLIVAIGSICSDSINVRSTKSGPGHLQIWSAGHLNNFANPPDAQMNFEFAFCHDFGEVWDLQCCPGGEPDEMRLGLVALATSSGKVAVYAVPSVHPSAPDGTPRATKPEPALVLETGLHESFQVSKVAWSKVKPHRFIAGGFTNGLVAIWDLTTTSVLLRSGNTILPFMMFHPHFITITGLSFSPVHEHYIVTSCADKSSKFFNLEDTSISHVEFNRGLFMDIAWLHHWMSAVAVIDDNTTLGTTTAMIHPLRNFIYQAHPSVTQAESCCLSVSVNDWMNAFVCSYDNGHVLLTFARKHCHMLDDRKRGHSQLITPEFHNFNLTPQEMIDCQSYDATSENFGIIFNSNFSASPVYKLKPVPLSDVMYFPSTAANKVCWNPNINSFLTMAVGYHSGFVIIGRIALHPTELNDLSLMMSEIHKTDQLAPFGPPCQDRPNGACNF